MRHIYDKGLHCRNRTEAPHKTTSIAPNLVLSHNTMPLSTKATILTDFSTSHVPALQLMPQESILSAANIVCARQESDKDRVEPCQAEASVSTHALVLSKRQGFLLFLKIFFKYIENTRVVSHKRHAKAIIRECSARHRQQDPAYASLANVIGQRLRAELGEIHWARAHKYYYSFCLKKEIKVVD